MVGKTISHYEVLEKLGEGGMGVVYKARDTHLDRFIAIKVLPPEKVADAGRKARFVQEAKAASALNHPNIITIYDISSDSGHDFIAMEYVAGKTLDQIIPRKGMRLGEALKCAVQIADALTKAHAAGIVHRDLKPGNIMVTGDGLVKVLDFGLAKLTETALDEDEATRTAKPHAEEGTVVGTAAYMSPEQAEGKPVDARSDIFSFGSVLYEMVTGRRAFQRDSKLSTLSAILREEPKPVSQVVPETPHDLEKVITRCLRKDPARRFQTMADLKVALEELKEDSESGKLGFRAVSINRGGRRRWLPYGVAAVIVAGAVLAWWLRPATEPVEMLPVPLTAFAGDEKSPSFSPDGKQIAFSWNGDQVGNFDIYVKLIGAGTALRLTTDAREDLAPAWSPDGRWIAFLRRTTSDAGANQVVLVSALGGQERVVGEVFVRGVVFVPALTWSPDGKWLAVPHTETGDQPFSIYRLSVDSGEKRRLTSPPDATLGDSAPAFSPSGRALAFSRSPAGEVWILRLTRAFEPDGAATRLTEENGWLTTLAWTHDGREIVYSSGQDENTTLRRVPAGGGRSRLLSAAGRNVAYPAIHTTRMAFVLRRISQSIWRINVGADGRASAPPEKFVASTRLDNYASFSPDGKKLLFISCRSGPWQLWIADADGGNPAPLTELPESSTATIRFPRWSPDGRRIAFDARVNGKASIFLVNAGSGSAQRLTAEHDLVPTWSRDGRWIYHVRWGRNWEVWKTPAGGGNSVRVLTSGVPWNVIESVNGRELYFLRGFGARVFKVPAAGGSDPVAVTQPGVYYFDVMKDGLYLKLKDSIVFQRFGAREPTLIANLPPGSEWVFSVSADGRSIVYGQREEAGGDIMLFENFR